MDLRAGAQHEETLEVGALLSVHCFQGKEMSIWWVSATTKRSSVLDQATSTIIQSAKCLTLAWDDLNRSLTLKAVAFTPWVLSLLKLALNDTSLLGSIGSLVSLLFVRESSSRLRSLEKAPSSMSAMRFPVRSITFNVAETNRTKDRELVRWHSQRENLQNISTILFTHVCKVSIANFYDFVEACVEICCFLGQWWDRWYFRRHFLTVNRSSQANTQ